MQGVNWELKILLQGEELAKLRKLSTETGKGIDDLVREAILRLIENTDFERNITSA